MTISTNLRDVMTKKLVSIKTTDQAHVAIKVMAKNDIGSVVVTEDGKSPFPLEAAKKVKKGNEVVADTGRTGIPQRSSLCLQCYTYNKREDQRES